MWYTGIGSRRTPERMLLKMQQFAKTAAQIGLTLRSGGADGADTAFEMGAGSLCEIFLPWAGFNNRKGITTISPGAFTIAESIHKRWSSLSPAAKKLMARNVHQIVGVSLQTDKASSFVVCWTPDGCESHTQYSIKTGGTGMAISLASLLNIPVYNWYNTQSYDCAWNRLAATCYELNTTHTGDNTMLQEVQPTLWVVKVNGRSVTQPMHSRTAAEHALLQLPAEQRTQAVVEAVTPTGQTLLLG